MGEHDEAPAPPPAKTKPVAYAPEDLELVPDPSPDVVLLPSRGVGDARGEHDRMTRGERSAWRDVALAFMAEVAILTVLSHALVLWIGARARLDSGVAEGAGWAGGGVLSLLVAQLVFHDRWRCIEAAASRASVFSGPLVAFAYANARGMKKLIRR